MHLMRAALGVSPVESQQTFDLLCSGADVMFGLQVLDSCHAGTLLDQWKQQFPGNKEFDSQVPSANTGSSKQVNV
jgi:hypothetical protein